MSSRGTIPVKDAYSKLYGSDALPPSTNNVQRDSRDQHLQVNSSNECDNEFQSVFKYTKR